MTAAEWSEFREWGIAAVRLLQDVVYDDELRPWGLVLSYQSELERYFSRLGLLLVVDETEGLAYLRQLATDELPDGYDQLPKLFRKTRMGYEGTVLCVLLREELRRFEEEEVHNQRCTIETAVLLDLWKGFFPRAEDDVKARKDFCGKWQLGHEKDSPQHFGFDESYLWQHTRRPPRYANPGLEHNGEAKDFQNGEYGPTLVNDFALDFITRHKDQPFFLYYPMILTHDPFQPTPDSPNWDPKAEGEAVHRDVKHFADMTAYMDKLIGHVDAKLAEAGIRDNTLLLFIGDNGTHSSVTSRFRGADYHGGKGTTTARGTHVPMIASWPGVIRQGRVSNDLISGADFLPTLCAAAGVASPADVDGVSFLPQIKGESGSPREWLYCWYSPRQSSDLTVKEFAFNHHYKLYRDGRIFDLRADPFESRPLEKSERSGAAAAAEARLRAVLMQFDDARPKELDRVFREKPGKNAATKKSNRKQ